MKNLYIAEKPSVAREFAKALGMKGAATAGARDGYLENEDTIVTWCVGHLITMSYPEVYDPALKKWSFDTIPFIPEEYKYEIIDASSKQFQIVSKLLNREDVVVIVGDKSLFLHLTYILQATFGFFDVTGKYKMLFE